MSKMFSVKSERNTGLLLRDYLAFAIFPEHSALINPSIGSLDDPALLNHHKSLLGRIVLFGDFLLLRRGFVCQLDLNALAQQRIDLLQLLLQKALVIAIVQQNRHAMLNGQLQEIRFVLLEHRQQTVVIAHAIAGLSANHEKGSAQHIHQQVSLDAVCRLIPAIT